MVAAGVTVAPVVASAQETASSQKAAASEKPESKAAPQKVHKVWTNDDISSVRSPSDNYSEEQKALAARSAAAAKPASTNDKTAPASLPQHGGPPALTNPKTVNEADSMIAWENRDIEAQQGTIAQLQKEIDQAPPEHRGALQKSLQERTQLLADTQKELQALQAKKETLQQKPSAGTNAAEDKAASQ